MLCLQGVESSCCAGVVQGGADLIDGDIINRMWNLIRWKRFCDRSRAEALGKMDVLGARVSRIDSTLHAILFIFFCTEFAKLQRG